MKKNLGPNSVTFLGKSANTRYTNYSRNSGRISEKQGTPFYMRRNLADVVSDELEEQDRRLFFQRVYIFAKNNITAQPLPMTSMHKLYDPDQPNFKHILEMELIRLYKECGAESFTTDKPSGLFLCMGDYTLLVVEGAEDTVGCICNKLSNIAADFFLSNRVFLVEDKINECYFRKIICRRAAAININEKFPAYTTTDVELMGQQHFTIREKLHALCEQINENVQAADELLSAKSSHHMMSRPDSNDTPLPPAEYNRLMPEVQRIELVLNCPRFYRTLPEYARLYRLFPRDEDDDAHSWPIPYNYMPMGVFKHTTYDVNLTFSDYGKKEEDTKEKGTEDESSESADVKA